MAAGIVFQINANSYIWKRTMIQRTIYIYIHHTLSYLALSRTITLKTKGCGTQSSRSLSRILQHVKRKASRLGPKTMIESGQLCWETKGIGVTLNLVLFFQSWFMFVLDGVPIIEWYLLLGLWYMHCVYTRIYEIPRYPALIWNEATAEHQREQGIKVIATLLGLVCATCVLVARALTGKTCA